MTVLNFKTLEDLQVFFAENNLNIADFVLANYTNSIASTIVENKDEVIIPESVNLKLNILSDMPIIEAKVGEENIIYVDECDNLKDMCYTTRIKFMESYIFVKACDMDGVTKVNLDIAFEDHSVYNVPFIVKQKQEDTPTLQISKDTLCQQNLRS